MQAPGSEQAVATAPRPAADRAPAAAAAAPVEESRRLRDAEGTVSRTAGPEQNAAKKLSEDRRDAGLKTADASAKEQSGFGARTPGVPPPPSAAPATTMPPAPPAPAREKSAAAGPAATKAAPSIARAEPSKAPKADSAPFALVTPSEPAPSAPVRPATPRPVAEPPAPGSMPAGGAIVLSVRSGDPLKQAEILDQLAYGDAANRVMTLREAADAIPAGKGEEAKRAAGDPAGRGGAGDLAMARRRAVQQATDRKEPVTLVYDLEPADAARFMAKLAERQDLRVSNVQTDPGFFDIYANAAAPDGVRTALKRLVDRSQESEAPVELAQLDKAKAESNNLRKASEAESLEKAKQGTDGREAGGAVAGLAMKDEARAEKPADDAPPALTAAAKPSAKAVGAAPAAPPAAAAPAPVVAGGAPAPADLLSRAREPGNSAPAAPGAMAGEQQTFKADGKAGATTGAPAAPRRVRIVVRLRIGTSNAHLSPSTGVPGGSIIVAEQLGKGKGGRSGGGERLEMRPK